MPSAQPRKRFQIHLSTAIVLMFVAGALIWANVRMNRTEKIQRPGISLTAFEKMTIVGEEEYSSHRQPRGDWAGSLNRYYGMPFDAKYSQNTLWLNFNNYQGHIVSTRDIWSIKAVALNVLIAFTALIGVAFTCEWLIRRRPARKEA